MREKILIPFLTILGLAGPSTALEPSAGTPPLRLTAGAGIWEGGIAGSARALVAPEGWTWCVGAEAEILQGADVFVTPQLERRSLHALAGRPWWRGKRAFLMPFAGAGVTWSRDRGAEQPRSGFSLGRRYDAVANRGATGTVGLEAGLMGTRLGTSLRLSALLGAANAVSLRLQLDFAGGRGGASLSRPR